MIYNIRSSVPRVFSPSIELRKPITVAARSKAWTVFVRSNAGVVDSNPTQGMDVYVRLFCVYVPKYNIALLL
jgi:hypothetical protein